MNKLVSFLLASIFILFSQCVCAKEYNFNLSTYYISPFGVFKTLYIKPSSITPGTICKPGTLATDEDGRLFFCGQEEGMGESGFWIETIIWKRNGSYVYPAVSDAIVDPLLLSVGIWTQTPEFKLTLESDGGIIAKGTFGSGVDLTTSGPGTRMIWYPRKAAFRAGTVEDIYWDDDEIGNYSFAAGLNTVAKSESSSAMGSGTYVGLKEVGGSSSDGVNSAAFGRETQARGYTCLSFGKQTEAFGDYAIAMGFLAKASGESSFAVGRRSLSEGAMSFAMGSDTFSTGIGAISMGSFSSAEGNYSMAMGLQSKAVGSYALSMGKDSEASGNSSISFGDSSTSGGDYSLSLGDHSSSGGTASLALGKDAFSAGEYSNAIGLQVIAQGDASNAFIQSSEAQGSASSAMGINVVAKSFVSTTLGRLNVLSLSGSSDTWEENDPLFKIGNGNPGPPVVNQDAVVILKNGNMGIGISDPTSPLQVMNLPEYPDNAAALVAGLTPGAFYKSLGQLKVVH